MFFDTTTNVSGYIAGAYAGSGASLSISAYSGTTPGQTTSGADILSQVTASAGSTSSVVSSAPDGLWKSVWIYATATSGFGYVVESLHPGAGYNLGTKANGDTSGNSITITSLNGEYFDVKVNEDGVAEETFRSFFSSI